MHQQRPHQYRKPSAAGQKLQDCVLSLPTVQRLRLRQRRLFAPLAVRLRSRRPIPHPQPCQRCANLALRFLRQQSTQPNRLLALTQWPSDEIADQSAGFQFGKHQARIGFQGRQCGLAQSDRWWLSTGFWQVRFAKQQFEPVAQIHVPKDQK